LQYFMMDTNPLLLTQFTDDLIIKCEFKTSILDTNIQYQSMLKCCVEATKLTDDAYNESKTLDYKLYISSYFTKMYSNLITLNLNLPILIRDIMLVVDKQDLNLNPSIEGIPLFPGSDTMMNYHECVIPSDTYYYKTTPFKYPNTPLVLNTCVTGFMHGDKDTRIFVKNNTYQQDIKVIVRYDNLIICLNNKPVITVLPELAIPSTNSYPLTKISDTVFAEGYWYSDIKYIQDMYNYPFPKATDTLVNKIFIDKLIDITLNYAVRIELEDNVMCKICKLINGSSNWVLKSNNITFNYPAGLVHYYTDHNVQPSAEFYDFIMKYQK
jgi:hypothetical protein